MIKFSSIEQFRNVVYDVRHHAKRSAGAVDADGVEVLNVAYTLPTLTFTGTVKLHGTNAGVRITKDGKIVAQSRNRDLTVDNDNLGFALWVSTKEDLFRDIVEIFGADIPHDTAVIYGEWAGPGIQKGVGISEIERRTFFIFEIVYLSGENRCVVPTTQFNGGIDTILFRENDIYSIYDFPYWKIDINFSKPEIAQNIMIEITNNVEAECPVAKWFGVDNGVGEGVVWTSQLSDSVVLRFKVKGEKHSVSKVKTLASVDVEQLNNVAEFVESVLTEERLQQGIDYLKEMQYEVTQKSTGHFIKWIMSDIFKEEADTIVANSLDAGMVGKQASNEARKWYFEKGIEQ